MPPARPRFAVPRRPAEPWSWEEIPCLPAFQLADAGAPAVHQTRARLCWDDEALHVRFDCEDLDAWGTFSRRDDPIWREEAVEVFLAPGPDDPVDYFEFEVSPLGVLFDATIHNPTSLRADLKGDPSWDCPGVRWSAGPGGLRQDWWAEISIPWRGLVPAGDIPRLWRANFYRIERPRGGEAEFSAWSPTRTAPADFHKPAYFGLLELA
ncbi:MAG: carbohydrate-binding family 9-like protein [Thermoanaerobaculia bacterium]